VNTILHEPASDRVRGVERAGEVHGELSRPLVLGHVQDWCTFDHSRVRNYADRIFDRLDGVFELSSVGHVRLPLRGRDVRGGQPCRSVSGLSRSIASGSGIGMDERTTDLDADIPSARGDRTTRRTRIRGVWLPAALKAILEPFPGYRQVSAR
jgi:hypothetical protein